jgi:hypothetical protein
MFCLPDVSDHVKRLSPLIDGLALLLAYLATVAQLLWAPKVRGALRVALRILGAAGIVPLVMVLPIVAWLALAVPRTESRVVNSGDGQQATLNYDSGFLGRDYSEVTLKQPGSCRHVTVFYHFGPSELSDPELEWVNNGQLRITYHARSEDPQHCVDHIGSTSVVCASKPW